MIVILHVGCASWTKFAAYNRSYNLETFFWNLPIALAQIIPHSFTSVYLPFMPKNKRRYKNILSCINSITAWISCEYIKKYAVSPLGKIMFFKSLVRFQNSILMNNSIL